MIVPLIRMVKHCKTVVAEHEFYILFEGDPGLARVVDRPTVLNAIKQLQALISMTAEEEEEVA